MQYLNSFRLPNADEENDFYLNQKRTCYTDDYPFLFFPAKGLERLTFSPITFLCGGNGSGKSTLLNIIASALSIDHKAPCNNSAFFPEYVRLCRAELTSPSADSVPQGSQIITSDDVFDYLIDLRKLNQGIDTKREDLFNDYRQFVGEKYANYRLQSMDDYEELKNLVDARRKTQSAFTRQRLVQNVREHSNGESAYQYFTQKIQENALYLLDEPENSLSAQLQTELASFIADSARFYNCQFIISSHSPFLLATPKAKIYNMDETPVATCKWTEIDTVRRYFDFFIAHKEEF